MFKSISLRLAVTYGLLFLTAITLINAILITLYGQQQYLKTERVYSEMAGIVSEMAAKNLKLTYFLNSVDDVNSKGLGGRVLVLNLEKKVVADSLKQFDGLSIENPEIRKTYSSKKSSVGYYTAGSQRIAMLTYPMFKKDIFTGVVLISYNVSDVWQDIMKFAFQVGIISIVVILLLLLTTYFLGLRIARPIKEMTFASLGILDGKTGVTVDINAKDEIGTLAKTFNMMSSELKRIDEGRKRFVSSVSHEFKTPLTSIKALIEPFMGEAKVDTALLNEHLSYVDKEIDRLSKLVRSLVSVTRLEEVKPSFSYLNLRNEISAAIKILSPITLDKGISIINNINENINIETDRDLLIEIAINIIDNAVKYGRTNGWVRIDTEEHDNIISIVISDNGKGIHEKDLPYIFDNFYMTDDARESGKGSGIGLYVVKRITEILNWDISVKSVLNEGTEFRLIIHITA